MRTATRSSAPLCAVVTSLLSVCALHGTPTETVAGDGVRRLGWQTFDVPDGLPAAEIFDLLQDADGHIWMATRAGLCRYDGAVFTSFKQQDGLPSDIVLTLTQASGRMWVGTDEGLVRAESDHFVDAHLGGHTIQALEADGDAIWIGTDLGLFRMSSNSAAPPVPVALGHNILTLARSLGYLWIGTEGGLFRLAPDGATLEQYPELSAREISSLLADGEGLWVGVADASQPASLMRLDASGLTRFGREDGLLESSAPEDMALDRHGRLWLATSNTGILIFDGDTTQVVGVREGLSHEWTESLLVDREGSIWVGTWGGLSRYDFDQFQTWTTRDGLTENRVYDIDEAADGLQVATWGGGIMQFSADTIEAVSDAHSDPYVREAHLDRRDRLWVATREALDVREAGVWRQVATGSRFIALAEDAAGNIWAGMWDGGGVAVLGQGQPRVFTEADGLVGNRVTCVLTEANGDVWIGADGGLSHFRDGRFTNYTVADGLPHQRVRALARNGDTVWIGTGNGLARLEGTTITSYGVAEGLTYGVIRSLMVDRSERLWIGTWGGGINLYDGLVFQALLRRDGLPQNLVADIMQDRDGVIWIGSEGGLTAYTPLKNPPPIRIVDVVTERRHGAVGSLELSASQGLLAVEFGGRNYQTRPEQMAYVYRLQGFDDRWKATRQLRVEYTDLPVGSYQFQVRAVDRELEYSRHPATVDVRIHPPYALIAQWVIIGLAIVAVAVATAYAVRRRRLQLQAERELADEMRQELEVARDMQMALLPTSTPSVTGWDVDGRCIPATVHGVGGDTFHYDSSTQGKLLLVIADAAGHAMEAAIPAVMFSSVLDGQLEIGGPLDQLLGRLNRALDRNLPGRTFVCASMARISLGDATVEVANAGCPYVLVYRAATDTVEEVELPAYPLGARSTSRYSTRHLKVEVQDRVVLYSDGLVEAVNDDGEQFGYERLTRTIQSAGRQTWTSRELLEHLINTVEVFAGDAAIVDDQTCVVATRMAG